MGEHDPTKLTILLFCDTFVHSTLSEHVDSITFPCPISIKQFRVVANNHNPHSKRLDFYGRTNPKSFWISVFSKQRCPTEEGWAIGNKEGKGDALEYHSFLPVADPFPYKEGIEDTFVPRKECITDTIAIRGSYHALSLCIYGTIIPTPTISSPLPHAQDNFTSAPTHLRSHSPTNLDIFSEPHLTLAGDRPEYDQEYLDEQDDGQNPHFSVKQENEELEQSTKLKSESASEFEEKEKTVKPQSEYSEETEIEDDSMASFLNPLDCCFGPVSNVFGFNGDASPLSMVALCLMAYCNSLHECCYGIAANPTNFDESGNRVGDGSGTGGSGDGASRIGGGGDGGDGSIDDDREGDKNRDDRRDDVNVVPGAHYNHIAPFDTTRNIQSVVYQALGNVPESVMEGLNSICLLLERMANDQALLGSYSCDDQRENEALNGSIVTGILGLFSVLGCSEAEGEDDFEPNLQKTTTSLCILKTACFALAISMKASASFATEFCVRGGMLSLLKIQQLPQFIPIVAAKQSLLLAVLSSIAHSSCMSFFLNEKLEGTNINDVLRRPSYETDETEVEATEEMQDPITGYEYVVSMLTVSQIPAVVRTIQEILQLANMYNALASLQAAVGLLCESTPSNDVFQSVAIQLQGIADLLTANSTPAKRSPSNGNLASPPSKPVPYSVLLHQMKFVHLLALIISSPNVTGAIQSHGQPVYAGVRKCVLSLLNSASLTRVLLDSNSDVLSLLIRTLILLSDCDFTAGEPKPSIQFSDLLPLPICIANPNSVTPLNLAFLLAYHLQALCELEGLCDPTLSNSLDDEVGTLHSLYCMTFQDLGRYAVASALAVALSSSATSYPSFNMLDAPLDDTTQYINHIFGEVARINAALDSEDRFSRTQNLFMQNFRHFIDPPPEGTEIQTVPTVYAISLLQQAVQCEELAEFVATIGPSLYQALTQWESKSGINAELKGRLQSVLDWLRPSVILKDKGVVELVNSLSTYALPIRERPHAHDAALPSSHGTPPSTPTPTATLPTISDTPSAPTTIPPPASPIPVVSDTTDTQKIPAQPPTPNSSNENVDLRLTAHHLSTLITTLRLIETEESPHAFVAIAQIDATQIITELLREVTAAMAQAIRSHDDEKRWLIVKRERQFLQLAVACLKVLNNIVRKFLAVGSLFSPKEIKHIIDSLLQLYTTLSQHSLFPLLNNDIMSSVLSSGSSSNSGHFPGLYKASRTVIDILCLFVQSGQIWSNHVFSAALLNAIDLPRNFFGGTHLLSSLLTTLPKETNFIVAPTTSNAQPPNAPSVDNVEESDNSALGSTTKPAKDLSFDVQFYDEDPDEPEPSLLTNLLSAFTSAIASSSSQLVYEQLCRATKSIVAKGNAEAFAVISPIIDTLEAINNNSNQPRGTTTEPVPSPSPSTPPPNSASASASVSASTSASTSPSPSAIQPPTSPTNISPTLLPQSTYYISRLLHLLLILVVVPNGKGAFLQKTASLPVLLRYMHIPSRDAQVKEVRSKHQSLALEILHCILSPRIPCNIDLPTNHLHSIIKTLFKMFTPSTLSHCLPVATAILHLLIILALNRSTLHQLFLVATRRVAPGRSDQRSRSTLFWSMLRNFSSYLEQQLPSLPITDQPEETTDITEAAQSKVSLGVLIAFLQSLVSIIERVKTICHETVSESLSSDPPRDVTDWKSVSLFVDFFSTRSLQHPLVEISENLQKYLEKVSEKNNEIYTQLKTCHSSIQHIIERLATAGKASSSAPRDADIRDDVAMHDDALNSADEVMTNTNDDVNPALYEQSTNVTFGILDDNDFMDDLCTPPAEVLRSLQYADAPLANEAVDSEGSSSASGGTGSAPSLQGNSGRIGGVTRPSDTEGPNAKKFRRDPPMVGMRGITMQRTPQTLRHDTFRARKPNTSRPPSMHVDTFVKKTGPDLPITKHVVSNNIKNNFNNNNNNNIKDILYMDAKTREMRQYSNLVQKRKEMTPTPTWDRPNLANKRDDDANRYLNANRRDGADRYDRDKYRTTFTPFNNSSYSRPSHDFRESNRPEIKSPTKNNSMSSVPYSNRTTPFVSNRPYDRNLPPYRKPSPAANMRDKRY